MGTWKVAIITLLASFKFSGVFINHCSANMLQTKESTHKKDNNQNSKVEKYFFDYKKEMVQPFGASVKQYNNQYIPIYLRFPGFPGYPGY